MDKRSIIDSFNTAHATTMINLTGIDAAAAMRQPGPGAHRINWIVGHLMYIRDGLMRLLGAEPFLTDQEIERYKRGSADVEPDGVHTDFKRLLEGLEVTHKRALAALDAMADEGFEEKLDVSRFPVPVSYPTVGKMLGLLILHEDYHAGQLGMARRLLGNEGMMK